MTIRRFLTLGVVIVGLWLAGGPELTAHAAKGNSVVAYTSISMFSTEDAAQTHCPRDVVVWLKTKTGIWRIGMRWYRRTRQGAYVCRREAKPQSIVTQETANEVPTCLEKPS